MTCKQTGGCIEFGVEAWRAFLHNNIHGFEHGSQYTGWAFMFIGSISRLGYMITHMIDANLYYLLKVRCADISVLK